jgi:hypothetical protein
VSSLQIFKKYSNIGVHENTSSGSQAFVCGRKDGRTDRHADMTKLIVAWRNFENVPENTSFWVKFKEAELIFRLESRAARRHLVHKYVPTVRSNRLLSISPFALKRGRAQKICPKLNGSARTAYDDIGRTFVMSVHPSVSPNATSRLLPDRFSQTFLLEIFKKMCWHNPFSAKTRRVTDISLKQTYIYRTISLWLAFKSEVNCALCNIPDEAEEKADDIHISIEISARNTITLPLWVANCDRFQIYSYVTTCKTWQGTLHILEFLVLFLKRVVESFHGLTSNQEWL